MSGHVEVRLTTLQAKALQRCADNGYDNGGFCEWLRSAGRPDLARALPGALESFNKQVQSKVKP